MRHGYDRPVSHAPALVRISERRRRSAYGIHIIPHVIGIDDLRRSTPFRHGLGIECPELVPCDLCLPHEERRDRNLALRRLIRTAERLVVRTSHNERPSGNSHHVYRCGSARNGFSEIAEFRHRRSFGIDLLMTLLRNACQLLVPVVRIVVSCIKMAADTLEIQFLRIVFVIEMGRHPFIGYTLRKEVDMAGFTGFIIHNADRVFQLALALPVYLFDVFRDI